MARMRARICIGYNDDGSPIVKHVSADGELALSDRICKALLESERRGEFLSAEDGNKVIPSFKEYAEYYYSTYKARKHKPTTAAYYEGITKHFYAEWENTPIDQITTQAIQEFLNKREETAESYLKNMLVYLRAILKSAMKDGLIAVNPADDNRIVIPSTKKTSREALSVEQVRDIVANTSKLKLQDRRYNALRIFTGMRRGEVLGLKWSDIDFEAGTIHVRRNVTYPKGRNKPHVGTTKTEHGIREIPLVPALIELLEPEEADGYVIGGCEPATLSVVRRMNERIEKTIDMHGATSHVFRHSFATMLNDIGATIKTIQDIIGDADFSTTANRYVHSRSESRIKAVGDVAEMLAS